MVLPQDYRYLLPSGDRSGWGDEAERRAATWLVQEGLLRPGAGDTLAPGSPVLRADVVNLLAGIVDRLSPTRVEAARFVSLRDGVLRLQPIREGDGEVGRAELEVPLAPRVRLFRKIGVESFAARELRLTPGEELRLIRDDGGEVSYLEALQSLLGPSTDRDSRYHRWVVSRTPEELAASLKRYGRIGRVLEIVPTRMGMSGRVLAATVEGTSGELKLKGLEVRWGLGLRENLFAIDRIVGPGGRVERFVFTGKGWGPRRRNVPGGGVRPGEGRRDLRADPASLLHGHHDRVARRSGWPQRRRGTEITIRLATETRGRCGEQPSPLQGEREG